MVKLFISIVFVTALILAAITIASEVTFERNIQKYRIIIDEISVEGIIYKLTLP